MIVNANPFRRRGARLAKPEDFVAREPRRMTWQQQLATVTMLNAALGGADRRKGRRG